MTPEALARNDTEDGHQAALIQWSLMNARRHYALAWLHHIPNGGSRGDSKTSRAIAGMRMKQIGTKKGIPDLFLPFPCQNGAGLYIEMKKPALRPKTANSKGGLSAEQIAFKEYAQSVGYAHIVCYSWIEAKEAIESYLGI